MIGLLGLDTLSVSQSDGLVRETVVSVGKQISRHWYMGYERNLSATGGNWQLVYSLAQRFKVRAQTGEDNALDFIWHARLGGAFRCATAPIRRSRDTGGRAPGRRPGAFPTMSMS